MIIQSLINAGSPLATSRDDLSAGNSITLNYVGAGTPTTYLWSLFYTPVDVDGTPSGATLSSTTAPSTGFTVDLPGPYVVKLVVDATLPSEEIEYVRLRFIPPSGLRLTAAGERRDALGVIPYDAPLTGWANDLNRSLLILSEAMTVKPSGNIFTVDPTAGVGDYQTIQDAIDAAGITPYVIRINPGVYAEDLVVPAGANLYFQGVANYGEFSSAIASGTNTPIIDGEHTGEGDLLVFDSLQFQSTAGSLLWNLNDAGGVFQFRNCGFLSGSLGAISVTASRLEIRGCSFLADGVFEPEHVQLQVVASTRIHNTSFQGTGPSIGVVSVDPTNTIFFDDCKSDPIEIAVYTVFSGDFALLQVSGCDYEYSQFLLYPTVPGTGGAQFNNCNIQDVNVTSMTGDLFITSSFIRNLYAPSSTSVIYRNTTVLNELLVNPAVVQTVASQVSLYGAGSETVLAAIERLLGQRDTVQTTDATTTFLGSIGPSFIPEDSPAKWLQVTVTATCTATSEYATWVFSVLVYAVVNLASFGPAGIQNDFTDAPGAWSVSISPGTGPSVDVIVTGEALKTIDWVSVMRVVP